MRLFERVGACVVRVLCGVEEGVAVCGTVVGCHAEVWVFEEDGEGVDCYDGAVVALRTEDGAGLVDGAGYLAWGVGAAVDEFVADGDGVEDGPVFCSVRVCGDFGEWV